MKKPLLILFIIFASYLFAFGLMIIVIISIGPLPEWLRPIAEFIFTPLIKLVYYFFGGIC